MSKANIKKIKKYNLFIPSKISDSTTCSLNFIFPPKFPLFLLYLLSVPLPFSMGSAISLRGQQTLSNPSSTRKKDAADASLHTQGTKPNTFSPNPTLVERGDGGVLYSHALCTTTPKNRRQRTFFFYWASPSFPLIRTYPTYVAAAVLCLF